VIAPSLTVLHRPERADSRDGLGHVQDLVRAPRDDIAAGAQPYVDWYAQPVHRSHAGPTARAAQPVSLRPRSVVAD
jgi:hypothetical protein